MDKSLMEIYAEARQLESALIAAGGDLDDERVQAALKAVEVDLPKKVDGYAFMIERWGKEAEGLREKAKLLQDAAKRIDSWTDQLNQRVKAVLQELKFKEVQGAFSRFSLKKNPASVVIDEGFENQLPEQFVVATTTYRPDKAKIKDALQRGEVIAHCRLEQSERVTMSVIRVARDAGGEA